VDPYYLTYKAVTLGYHPQVILSGRKINDGMGNTSRTDRQAHDPEGLQVNREPVIVLGLTFKEDCPISATPASST